jgi:hypothetical protein
MRYVRSRRDAWAVREVKTVPRFALLPCAEQGKLAVVSAVRGLPKRQGGQFQFEHGRITPKRSARPRASRSSIALKRAL